MKACLLVKGWCFITSTRCSICLLAAAGAPLRLCAVDLGIRDVPDDQKVNLGACLLRAALSKWAHEFSKLYMSGAPIPGLDDTGAEQLPRFSDELPPAGEGAAGGSILW